MITKVKRLKLLAILFYLSAVCVYGQQNQEPIPININSKWGYSDNSGNILIETKYNSVERFSEDFAVVNYNGNYGFISITGEKLTPLKYENAKSFSEGRAAVMFNKFWGMIGRRIA